MANVRQAALVRARQKRVELNRDRAARDGRIEAAAAEVFVQQQARADAQQAVAQADVEIGGALRLLLEDGLTVEAAAQLCDLTVTEVRRLTRQQVRVGHSRGHGAAPVIAQVDKDGGGQVTELGPRTETAAQASVPAAAAGAGETDGHAERRAD